MVTYSMCPTQPTCYDHKHELHNYEVIYIGLLKYSVLRSYIRAISEGFSGNIQGEGRILGWSI